MNILIKPCYFRSSSTQLSHSIMFEQMNIYEYSVCQIIEINEYGSMTIATELLSHINHNITALNVH